jgi:hypothetical protein
MKRRLNMQKKDKKYKIQLLSRPGIYLSEEKSSELVRKLRDTAKSCFDEMPDYQVMKGGKEELADKILAVAWDDDGSIAGFCSTIELDVKGVGKVLHLGLTCVRPDCRSGGLTMSLTKKAVLGYILRNRLIGKLWITNCAAVLSSLGSVSLNFEGVYPSPFERPKPTDKHRLIAEAIDKYYRDKIFINDFAYFDNNSFVFRKSVKDTVFQKSADDKRYHHRMEPINKFYRNLMDFDEGDEVLQVGFVTSLTAFVHLARRRKLMNMMTQWS